MEKGSHVGIDCGDILYIVVETFNVKIINSSELQNQQYLTGDNGASSREKKYNFYKTIEIVAMGSLRQDQNNAVIGIYSSPRPHIASTL